MFRFSSALLSTVYAVATFTVAHTYELSDQLPIDEKVNVSSLSNGIDMYVQSHNLPNEFAAVRVVVKKDVSEKVNLPPFTEGIQPLMLDDVMGYVSDSSDRTVYAIDYPVENTEQLIEFFTYCQAKIEQSVGLSGEIGVIAVGDFATADMKAVIDEHFSKLSPACLIEGLERGNHIRPTSAVHTTTVSVHFPAPTLTLKTYDDLKKQWSNAFFQHLFVQRLGKSAREQGAVCSPPHSRALLGTRLFGASAISTEECTVEETLEILLQEVAAIRKLGFSEEELMEAKAKLKAQIEYLAASSHAADHASLASYYIDQYVHSHIPTSYTTFMEASLALIDSINTKDLMDMVPQMLTDDKRMVDIAYPKDSLAPLTLTQIQEIADLAAIAYSSDEKGSGDQSIDRFYQLPLVDWEKKVIEKIISTVSKKNLVQLAFEKREMEKKGRKVNHVHPMRFMGYVFSRSDLKQDMRDIKKSNFKWDNVIDGYSRRMREEAGRNNLVPHVPGFAHQVRGDPEVILQLIQRRDYEGVIRYLVSFD